MVESANGLDESTIALTITTGLTKARDELPLCYQYAAAQSSTDWAMGFQDRSPLENNLSGVFGPPRRLRMQA